MRKMNRITTILILGSLLCSTPAFSEIEEEMVPGMDPPALDDARQLLADTAALDDLADLEAAEMTLSDVQMALDQAVAEGADPADVDALTIERDAAQAAVDKESDESQTVYDAIVAMSDEQVTETNRALNNTRHNGRILDLDAATLQDIVDHELGHREIMALTKALEEEAKFEGIASRFEQKYDESGRERFLENRDRALERGEQQRQKFERKADAFVDARDEMRSEIRSEARDEAKSSARANAKAEAKQAARDAARDEAKNAVKANGRGRN